jgi:hypothetical protein
MEGRAAVRFSNQALARAARGEVENALDTHGWPWRRQISLWLDSLLLLEEAA